MIDLKPTGLKILIDKCPADKSLPVHLAQEFQRISGIRLLIRSAQLRCEAIRKKADEESLQLQKEIGVQQSRCLHESTTHHTGYEDSYTDCDICGKTL